MIVKMTFQNTLNIPIVLRGDNLSPQRLTSGQALEVTFDIDPDDDGAADLFLILEPV